MAKRGSSEEATSSFKKSRQGDWDLHVWVDGELRRTGVPEGSTFADAISQVRRIGRAEPGDLVQLHDPENEEWIVVTSDYPVEGCRTFCFAIQRGTIIPEGTVLEREFKLTKEVGRDGEEHEYLSYPREFQAATRDVTQNPEMYIRACYVDILKQALDEFKENALISQLRKQEEEAVKGDESKMREEDEEEEEVEWEGAGRSGSVLRRKVVVVGNSGIGKSGLLVYAAFCELRDVGVVYFLFREAISAPGVRRLFHIQRLGITENDGTLTVKVRITAVTTKAFDQDGNELVLADGVAPAFLLGNTVERRCLVAASPAKGNYSGAWRNAATFFYMGPWTKQEVYAAADIYQLKKSQIDTYFDRNGGFPMLIYNNPSLATESYIEEALVDLGHVKFHHKSMHRMVHVSPRVMLNSDGSTWIDYREFFYDFNSAVLKSRFLDIAQLKGKKFLMDFVKSATFPQLQCLRGSFGEFPMAVTLSNGGRFSQKLLLPDMPPAPAQDFVLDERCIIVYNDGMVVGDTALYLPRIPDQGCWDAFFLRDGKVHFVQLTFGQKKFSYIKSLLKKLGKSEEDAVMMFGLPSDRFEVFRFQKWLNREGRVDCNLHEQVKQCSISLVT